ncbi:CPBP family intramembrane glutamic endopeptidase [Haloechinothrix alba]|uniref:CPBP family intramembrane glutamic endopeptidase n=1 Tax=Haloechinothrix alba TaxID=664784 RepID=UPI001C3D7416|nr:type II CAAX endopeptidase family protein [Haloechinothrix alba]
MTLVDSGSAGTVRRNVTRSDRLAVLATVVAVLAGANVVTAYGSAGAEALVEPAIAVVLLGLAHRFGLTWADIGISRHTWRKGAAYGGAAIALVGLVYLAGMLLPATRAVIADARYDMALGSALLLALVVIPLKTVLLEEVAFRGVLLGMLSRPAGRAWAVGASSAMFGLWHILPTLEVAKQDTAFDVILGPGSAFPALGVAAVVVFTGVAGVVLCELRRRTGSLLAPLGLHWATNGLGVLISALLWSGITA